MSAPESERPNMFVYCLFLVLMFVAGLVAGWYAQTYYWHYLVAPTYALPPEDAVNLCNSQLDQV